jgi:hypothetical protein
MGVPSTRRLPDVGRQLAGGLAAVELGDETKGRGCSAGAVVLLRGRPHGNQGEDGGSDVFRQMLPGRVHLGQVGVLNRGSASRVQTGRIGGRKCWLFSCLRGDVRRLSIRWLRVRVPSPSLKQRAAGLGLAALALFWAVVFCVWLQRWLQHLLAWHVHLFRSHSPPDWYAQLQEQAQAAGGVPHPQERCRNQTARIPPGDRRARLATGAAPMLYRPPLLRRLFPCGRAGRPVRSS